jgi:hypothetical protein
MGTTPIYGFPYPDPSDLVANYPALGQQLAEDIEDVLPTLGGLTPVTPTSIANSGGSASLTGNAVNFTGVTTVSINGVFTSAYLNYIVVVSPIVGSAASGLLARWRVAGVDATTNYTFQEFQANNTTLSGSRAAATSGFRFGTTRTPANGCNYAFMAFGPQSAVPTNASSISNYDSEAGALVSLYAGFHDSSTSYDGFTILGVTGTITGTVRVYALAN